MEIYKTLRNIFKPIYNRFYSLFAIGLIEIPNWLSETIGTLSQLSIYSIEILQLLIAILTIWKLTNELRKQRTKKNKNAKTK
jgi:hypothetical protein